MVVASVRVDSRLRLIYPLSLIVIYLLEIMTLEQASEMDRNALELQTGNVASPAASPEVRERYRGRLLGMNDTQMEACWRLRHRSFVQQRRWVLDDPARPGLESDRYDEDARHLTVFHGERLVAYLRALPWQLGRGFMLQREFRPLLPLEAGPYLIQPNAVELTRLVVASPPELALREVLIVSELLFKLFYQLAQRERWEHIYIVVEQRWLPLFVRRFGFPFESLGRPHTFPDGTRTVAAQARLSDLEVTLAKNDPDKLAWYREP